MPPETAHRLSLPGTRLAAEHERLLVMLYVLVVFLWSLIGARDLRMWAFEAVLIVIAWIVTITTARSLPLSRLAYRLIAAQWTLQLIGAHYLFAEVPAGAWVRELFTLQRNPYDRFAHLCFGVVAAIVAREFLLRTSPLTRGKWLVLLSFSLVMCASAVYEIFEWWAWIPASRVEPGADFLGAQGDVWDAQWDMFLAGLGAVLGQLLLSRAHDVSIAEVEESETRRPEATRSPHGAGESR